MAVSPSVGLGQAYDEFNQPIIGADGTAQQVGTTAVADATAVGSGAQATRGCQQRFRQRGQGQW